MTPSEMTSSLCYLCYCRTNLDVPYYRRDVPAGQTMTKRGALYVNSQDTTSLVVTFISRELPQVTATKDF